MSQFNTKPYNVSVLLNGNLVIETAVAGFAPEELETETVGHQFVIRGKKEVSGVQEVSHFLTRLLSYKEFVQSYYIPPDYVLEDARYLNGIIRCEFAQTKVSVKLEVGRRASVITQEACSKAQESAKIACSKAQEPAKEGSAWSN